MANPYVIFAGDSQNHLEPRVSAPNKKSALAEAKALEAKHTCVEAVFMPEDNFDVNEVVYSNYKRS